jgi:CBS domain-containing membrane protein
MKAAQDLRYSSTHSSDTRPPALARASHLLFGMNNTPTVVRDLMSADVVTLGRNEKLGAADDLMRLGRIRHLPVVDEDGALAGIVSQRDLFHSGLIKALGYGAHAQQHALATVTVKEAMTTDVVTTTPETTLRAASQTMIEKKIGCLVVVDGGRIAGILAESDFVRLASRAL